MRQQQPKQQRKVEAPSDDPLLLTIDQVAALLGIHRTSVYRKLLDTKEITPVRFDGRPRIRRSDLAAYLDRKSA